VHATGKKLHAHSLALQVADLLSCLTVTPAAFGCLSGCSAGHGVVPKGTSSASVRASAWKSTYVKTFTCQACPENHVAFQPGSNLYVAFDGADWSLKCIGQSSGLTGRPKVAPPSGAGNVIDVVASVPTPGRPQGSPVVLSNYTVLEAGVMPMAAVATGALVAPAGSDFSTAAVEVAHAKRRKQIQAGWYRRGRRRTRGSGGRTTYDCAPWLPGQCIDCALVGAEADPTGTYCGKCTQAARQLLTVLLAVSAGALPGIIQGVSVYPDAAVPYSKMGCSHCWLKHCRTTPDPNACKHCCVMLDVLLAAT